VGKSKEEIKGTVFSSLIEPKDRAIICHKIGVLKSLNQGKKHISSRNLISKSPSSVPCLPHVISSVLTPVQILGQEREATYRAKCFAIIAQLFLSDGNEEMLWTFYALNNGKIGVVARSITPFFLESDT
jgi:hypothetical protein